MGDWNDIDSGQGSGFTGVGGGEDNTGFAHFLGKHCACKGTLDGPQFSAQAKFTENQVVVMVVGFDDV